MRRVTTLALAAALLLTLNPFGAGAQTAREEGISRRIEHMIANCFDRSMFFSVDGKPVKLISQVNGRAATPGEIYQAYEPQSLRFNDKHTSAAFMAYAYYYLFGLNPTLHADQTDLSPSQTADQAVVTDFLASCLPGDVIHYIYQVNVDKLEQHWVMVRSVDPQRGSVVVYESNHQKTVDGQAVQTGIRDDRVISAPDFQHHTLHRYRPKASYPLMQWTPPTLEVRQFQAESGKARADILIKNPSAYPITWTGYYRAEDSDGLEKPENRVIVSEGVADRWKLSQQAERRLEIANLALPETGRHFIQFFAASGREEVLSEIFVMHADGTIVRGTTPLEVADWTEEQLRAFANGQEPYRGTRLETDGLVFGIHGNVARFDGVAENWENYNYNMASPIAMHIRDGVFRIPSMVNGCPVVAASDLVKGFWAGESFGGMNDTFRDFDTISLPEGMVALGDEALNVYGDTHLRKDLILPSSLRYLPTAPGQFLGDNEITISRANPILEVRDKLLINHEYKSLVCYLGGTEEEALLLPDGIEYVLPYAFSRRGPRSINFGKGLLGLAENSFFALNDLDEVILPESTNFIADNAFQGCNGFTLTLPSIFRGHEDRICPGYGVKFIYLQLPLPISMRDVDILAFAQAGRKIEGAERIKENDVYYTVWRNHARIDGGYPRQGEIPRWVQGYPVVAVASNAFESAALKRIVLPENVVAIGSGAFDVGMSMEQNYAARAIHLPASLRLTGDMARVFLPTITLAEGNPVFALEGDFLINRETGQRWHIRHFNEETRDWD